MQAAQLPRRPHLALSLLAALAVLLTGRPGRQSLLRSQEGNKTVAVRLERAVQLPTGSAHPAIVVTEFSTQGELHPDGRNLAVSCNNQVVPWKVLQVGPGDFCRVAFQTVRAGKSYKVSYGGSPVEDKPPAWTAEAGLLLETHRWKACDLHKASSVQEALAGSERVGSDYVPTVSHRFNPFNPDPAPFLSLYRGTLRIDTAGTYLFFTSSQDCSFLLIDGKQVVAAPGGHGPVGEARIKGELNLSAGPHSFEYYHAAAGPDACMVAAWQPPRSPAPELIPARFFAAGEVAHLTASAARHPAKGLLPEYSFEIVGEVPLPDVPDPLIRVQFKTSRAAAGKPHWEFGDGQTSDLVEPTHIYLHPGLFTVKLINQVGMNPVETSNRVLIHRPVLVSEEKNGPDKLRDYMAIVERYDSTLLPPHALLQTVRAYEQLGQTTKAARLGKTCLLSDRTQQEQASVYILVKLVGPLLRDQLDDPAGAREAWQAAAKALRREEWKADCELEAADICLADLDLRNDAKVFLEAAAGRLAMANESAQVARLHRLWGDFHARAGDRKAARAAYARAFSARGARGTTIEQNAWRGAASRSTEAFLRQKELDRALEELRRWQDLFPTDKNEGHLSLLQAQYYVARGKFQQILPLADDLVAVNPDSPYADRLVYLAAESAEKLGRLDRARAGYQGLVTDYPGSPLVASARQKLSQLQSGKAPEVKPLPKK
jgi:tetratricopeptide (TPR) repeat protein